MSRLAYWMGSDNAKASVAAANILLDRGYGKSLQRQDVKINDERMGFRLPRSAKTPRNGLKGTRRRPTDGEDSAQKAAGIQSGADLDDEGGSELAVDARGSPSQAA